MPVNIFLLYLTKDFRWNPIKGFRSENHERFYLWYNQIVSFWISPTIFALNPNKYLHSQSQQTFSLRIPPNIVNPIKDFRFETTIRFSFWTQTNNFVLNATKDFRSQLQHGFLKEFLIDLNHIIFARKRRKYFHSESNFRFETQPRYLLCIPPKFSVWFPPRIFAPNPKYFRSQFQQRFSLWRPPKIFFLNHTKNIRSDSHLIFSLWATTKFCAWKPHLFALNLTKSIRFQSQQKLLTWIYTNFSALNPTNDIHSDFDHIF